MSEFIWRSTGEYQTASNIRRFMNRHGIADYPALIGRANGDIRWFWTAALEDLGLQWYRPWDHLLDDSHGIAWTNWFVGGRTNITYNCIDRHASGARATHPAIIWEGEDGASRTITYAELDADVSRLAAGLQRLGVGAGDRVGLFMPMIPEAAIALFACFKIGAAVVPTFSGFAAEALATRLEDAEAKVLLTADGGFRRGRAITIKGEADRAADAVPSIAKVVVVRRLGAEIPWNSERDIWWDELLADSPTDVPTAELDAEAWAMVMYTSGTTGKPKGTISTHAGCLAQIAKEVAYYIDLRRDDRLFWFTDIGWMMGPWEIIGATFFGATVFLYEGAPDHPAPDRVWAMVERHRITHLGISPTAIRVLMRAGDDWVNRHDLSSLRILASSGEPWDPESWNWYFSQIGKRRLPIINFSGGTELCGCLVSPMPIMDLKPCTVGGPGLAMDIDILDEEGRPVRDGIGYLVCRQPAPSMTKGFLGAPQRYLETYFERFPGVWNHGDWASQDADGLWFLHGRSDDTIKIAGKRTGPAEIEAALIAHDAVSEAAAIGVPDEVKGEAIVCFVVLASGAREDRALHDGLAEQVVHALGKTHRPAAVHVVTALPKTRSGKVLRGTIKRRYLGQDPGDLSSMENPDALAAIAPGFADAPKEK
ncbi:MAG: AMP-binding protein [Candidatus Binatia bacterium]